MLVASLVMVAGNSENGSEDAGRLDSAASRETVFLLNNLFLTAFMFTVLVGTLFPLVAEAMRGVKVSVGEPFFNRMSLPLVGALLFLVGVGPALPWGAASTEVLKRKLLPPIAGAAADGRDRARRRRAEPVYACLIFAFVGYAAFANLREYWIGMRARHAAHGEEWGLALMRLVSGNRRRYGGYAGPPRRAARRARHRRVARRSAPSAKRRSSPARRITVSGHTAATQGNVGARGAAALRRRRDHGSDRERQGRWRRWSRA